MSRIYKDAPFSFEWDGVTTTAQYEPGESSSSIYGGNSNWRGPVWMPMNYLLIESLGRYHIYYGDDFKVEMPTGSGKQCTLQEVGSQLRTRVLSLFRKGPDGKRPCMQDGSPVWDDPHFQDLVWFHEYFDAETGRGCGACHQTGWTALAARLFFEERFRLANHCPNGREVADLVRYIGV